jgi:transposase
MKRLRVHSAQAMASRLFIQFLALILVSHIRKVIKSHHKLKNLTAREALETLESIIKVKYSGRYGQLITEIGPLQRDILDAFNVSLFI